MKAETISIQTAYENSNVKVEDMYSIVGGLSGICATVEFPSLPGIDKLIISEKLAKVIDELTTPKQDNVPS
jgi:hypothetical protein